MKFHLLTLFPGMFSGPLTESILKRAQENGLLEVALHNIRDYASDKHRTTDDYPYGGGAGMVMKVEPLAACLEAVRTTAPRAKVVLTSPRGTVFTQEVAQDLAAEPELIVICGRYEGVDERVKELFVDHELSIGDYVLTGGELAAMVVIDAVTRLLPGVLGSEESAVDESFSAGLLEYPQYTRPPEFRGLNVPDVLLSGNHAVIARWRHQQALRRTWQSRPDLLRSAILSPEDKAYLQRLQTAGES
jgi:tRNA (guanine37-N1)-methyltransferase